MQLRELQDVIARTYLERDTERGVAVTIAWLAEEVGELAKAVRKGSREEQVLEMGDVLAWLASLANQLDIDFDEAIAHFANGCPKCGVIPCACP
jgi:NTP pyrophosphatase (non-canonical NTP hydrolase)